MRVDDNFTTMGDALFKDLCSTGLYRERFAIPETDLGVRFSAQIRRPRKYQDEEKQHAKESRRSLLSQKNLQDAVTYCWMRRDFWRSPTASLHSASIIESSRRAPCTQEARTSFGCGQHAVAKSLTNVADKHHIPRRRTPGNVGHVIRAPPMWRKTLCDIDPKQETRRPCLHTILDDSDINIAGFRRLVAGSGARRRPDNIDLFDAGHCGRPSVHDSLRQG